MENQGEPVRVVGVVTNGVLQGKQGLPVTILNGEDIGGSGGTSGVTSINGKTGIVNLYSNEIQINNENSDTIQQELETIKTEKLAFEDFKIKKARDVEPVSDETKGLLFLKNGTYKHAKTKTVANTVTDKLTGVLVNDIVLDNNFFGIINWDTFIDNSTSYNPLADNSGFRVQAPNTNYKGWLRLDVKCVSKKSDYPIAVNVTTILNGATTANVQNYVFFSDGITTMTLDSENDNPLLISDEVQFRFSVSSGSTDTKVTIKANSFMTIENNGANINNEVIPVEYLEYNLLKLKTTTPTTSITSTPSLINFSSIVNNVGDNLTWDISTPDTIKINNTGYYNLNLVSQIEQLTGNNAVTVKVLINGLFVQNFIRKLDLSNIIPIDVLEFNGFNVLLNKDDLIQISLEISGGGTARTVTNTDHVANLFSISRIN